MIPVTFTSLEKLQELDVDTIIDVRSPAEYNEDHLPGAINLPVLDDAQRAEVGTIYSKVSPFMARKKGGALVAQNTAIHLQRTLAGKNGATGAGFVKFFEDSDNGSNAVTLLGPASTADIDITLPTQAGTVVVSNTTDGNDVQLDSLGLNTAASGTAGELRATNDITAFYSSDVSLKENIIEIPSALDMVDKIRGVFFDWKDDYIESKGGIDGYFMRKRDVGLIAQEVEAVLPEIVGTRKDGIKAIKYDRLTALLLQAIKELQAKIK